MNYPDDIERFNDDPRSPLYNEPEQEVTATEIADFFEKDDVVETMVESEVFVDELKEFLKTAATNPDAVLARYARRLILASEQYAKECIEND